MPPAKHTTEQARAGGDSFNEIVAFIDNMRDRTANIASATEEQAAVAAEVDQSIVQISDMTKQTQEAMHDAMAHNQRMAQMSAELLQSSQRFEL